MTALTPAAALLLAASCGAGEPPIPPAWLVGIALGESGLRPSIISMKNRNGTVDNGIGQINDATLAQVGLTKETALDPCENFAGMARYLRMLSAYHRGPNGPFDVIYVEMQLKNIARVSGDVSVPPKSKPATDEPSLVKLQQGANTILAFDGWEDK